MGTSDSKFCKAGPDPMGESGTSLTSHTLSYGLLLIPLLNQVWALCAMGVSALEIRGV